MFQVQLEDQKQSAWQQILLKLMNRKYNQFGRKIKRRRHNMKIVKQQFKLVKMLGKKPKQFYRVLYDYI